MHAIEAFPATDNVANPQLDASAGVPAYVARHVNDDVSILYAGEAEVSHPTPTKCPMPGCSTISRKAFVAPTW